MVLTAAVYALLQALNGHDVKAEEVVKAQEMFQALHEARVTASKQQLNELVSKALTANAAYAWRPAHAL